MSDETDPKKKENDAAVTFIWLIVGLAPTLILLAMVSAKRPEGFVPVLFICAACNLLGGLGCTRRIKDGIVRVFLGLLLAGFFFILSWVVALFQACSHMNI